MFVDLDNFKDINDSYGHDVGDRVLQKIAARLKDNARSNDTVSRHSGDEFLYLLMESGSEQNVKLIVEKLIRSIQVPCEVGAGDRIISPIIHTSIGIAMFPKDGNLPQTLIKAAAKAMYRARKDRSGYLFVHG